MNRVYGLIGIKSIMANWNADFSGFPKSISDGSIFGSDKALKYSIKKYWDDLGEKILYMKSFKTEKDKMRPRSLEERYNQIFNTNLTKKDKSEEVIKNLFSALDVKSFGTTFAEEGNNISITGAVQIGQGFNVYGDSSTEEQQILSPFRSDRKVKNNEEAKEANQSTLGTKIVSDEAHYLYPFYINPISYKDYVDMGITQGYTEEDYRKFKEGALVGATALNTNSKAGCENEFGLFIETDEKIYLPNLAQFMKFSKDENGENTIIFATELNGILQGIKEDIKSIEIYYNNYKLKLNNVPEGAKKINIFTRKEV
ncbi:type I CRISPR-associated protein Cas7 [Clostridium sp. LBM24168]